MKTFYAGEARDALRNPNHVINDTYSITFTQRKFNDQDTFIRILALDAINDLKLIGTVSFNVSKYFKKFPN